MAADILQAPPGSGAEETQERTSASVVITVVVGGALLALVSIAALVWPVSAADRAALKADKSAEEARKLLSEVDPIGASIALMVDPEGTSDIGRIAHQQEADLEAAEKLVYQALGANANHSQANALLGAVLYQKASHFYLRAAAIRYRTHPDRRRVADLTESHRTISARAMFYESLSSADSIRDLEAQIADVRERIVSASAEANSISQGEITDRRGAIAQLVSRQQQLSAEANAEIESARKKSDTDSIELLRAAYAKKAESDRLESDIEAARNGVTLGGTIENLYAPTGELEDQQVVNGTLDIGLNGFEAKKQLLEDKISALKAAEVFIQGQIADMNESSRNASKTSSVLRGKTETFRAEIGDVVANILEKCSGARTQESKSTEALAESVRKVKDGVPDGGAQLLSGFVRLYSSLDDHALLQTIEATGDDSLVGELDELRASIGDRLNKAMSDAAEGTSAYASSVGRDRVYSLGEALGNYLSSQIVDAMETAAVESSSSDQKSSTQYLEESLSILQEKVIKTDAKKPELAGAVTLMQQIQSRL